MTGGKRKPHMKKRKYELGRPAANTKLGEKRIHTVRCRGGNLKFRALRLDSGNFSWGSEGTHRAALALHTCAGEWCALPCWRQGAQAARAGY